MVLKLAVRNLFRARWRSLLTAGGIAVAVAMMTWTLALIDGLTATMIRGVTAVEMGQVQLHRADYVERPNLFRAFDERADQLDAIRALAPVDAATGRVIVNGLIGHERRSQVARLVGVDPARERDVTLLATAVTHGRWLRDEAPDYPAAREAVLGEGLARQLEISVGDELVVLLQAADGSLGNDLLVVVGIVLTGNSAIDRMTTYMHLDDVQFIAALDGRLHEIAIRVNDYVSAPAVADTVAAALHVEAGLHTDEMVPETLLVQAWQQIVPELSTMLELNERSIDLTFLIIYLVVALGILNSQRMSALERRREFGVLLAVGLSPGRLCRIILVETVVLTLAGAIIGMGLGLLLSYYHAEVGLNLAAFTDESSFSMMGVSFSERIYFALSLEAAITPVILIVAVAFVCAFWPALSSARIEATQAISGRAG